MASPFSPPCWLISNWPLTLWCVLFQSSAPQYITLRKHMSSAFQWAPVCAFPSPTLAFKVHQRHHRRHHPQPRPVATLPGSPSFAHLPLIGCLLSILKATFVWERKAQQDNSGVFFILINLWRPVWVWEVTVERHGNKTQDSSEFKCVCLQAGRCVVKRWVK